MNQSITEELINDLSIENKLLKERVRGLEINLEHERIEAYKKGYNEASMQAIKHLTPTTNN